MPASEPRAVIAPDNRKTGFANNFMGQSPEDFGITPVSIYIYNVSPLEFKQPRFPNHPRLFIPACPKGQDYVMATGVLTHPFREWRRDENGNRISTLTNGYREATKMISPKNPGIGNDFIADDGLSVGDNWNEFGVFWSTNNPPTKGEIADAKARLEKKYNDVLEMMEKEESINGEKGAAERVNRIARAAAEHFGKTYSWRTIRKNENEGRIPCSECGEMIVSTARKCRFCGEATALAKPATKAAKSE